MCSFQDQVSDKEGMEREREREERERERERGMKGGH